MRGILRHIVMGTVVAVSVGACSGGGCTSGCGGITPLPGGFAPEARIENAGALRITDSGFGFIEQNLGTIASGVLGSDGGPLTFAIDETSGTIDAFITDIDYTVCPGGPTESPLTCTVEIDVASLNLDFAPNGPNHLTVSGDLPIRLQDLPVTTDVGDLNVSINQPRNCPGTPSDPFAQVPVTVRISLETDTDPNHARFGYSKLGIEDVSIDTGALEDQIAICGGFTAAIADYFRGFIIDQVGPGLIDTVKETVEEQLCQKSNPEVDPPCPTGTNDIEGICRYGTDAESECVSMVLGTDGHAELGSLLSSFSPGTKGGLDFILAAGGDGMREDGSGQWGDLDPIGGGATVGMYGGVEPRPVSQCVPLSTLQKPTGIPIPDELRANTVTGWPAGFPRPGQVGPDVSVAISEDFLNYAFAGMYNSGLLCLGITTETVGDILNTGTVGIFAASLRDLTIQRENQPIAIVLRPTEAPQIEIGNGTDLATDPSIRIELNGIEFDFYVWSLDRFLRVFTAKFDLAVPANLEVTEEGLVPVIEDVEVANGTVVNSELLAEDPQALADALASLISGQVGSLLAGGIPPIDISSALDSYGLRLAIPPSTPGQGSPGLRKLTKGSHDFLGIFTGLETTAPQAAAIEAWVHRREIDRRGLRAETATKSNGPTIVIATASSIEGEAEFQAKVDHGPWKPFQRGSELVVRDPSLRLEGKHTVLVRGREVGKPFTLAEAVPVTVVIDTTAPDLELTEVDGGFEVEAFDVVTAEDDLEARVRIAEGAWSRWMPLSDLAIDDAEDVTVEVRDEEGNVASASSALIRGAPRGDGTDGCNCDVPGAKPRGASGLAGVVVMALGGLAMAARARRRRSLVARALDGHASRAAAAVVALGVSAASPGCDCGDDTPIDTTSSSTGAGGGGEGGNAPSCSGDDCEVLTPGLIGAYTSVTVDDEGTIWVAGYAEANWVDQYTWGDLVVGAWNGEAVEWEAIDGVPSEPEVDPDLFDTSSFRGGQTSPGDDVGLWTSIAASDDGQLGVAYYDRTNRQLKIALRSDGDWTVDVVESVADGDVGRYAELWFEGGAAVVAYQSIEPAATGFVTSKVRIARAGSSGGFQYEDVSVELETPCRAELCTSGSVCVADSGQCVASTTGCPECADGEECIATGGTPACAEVLDDGKLDTYPYATGDYIAAARDPGGQVGLVWYDRVHGTLVAARKVAGTWTTQVVDGGGTPPVDVGIGATLAIDGGGEWHIAYVDGFDEALKYARLSSDGAVAQIEVVDDGVSVDGAPFADGKHVVGDDASIAVSGNGDVRIAYQDATAGVLRVATGTLNGSAHDWALQAIPHEGAGGAFARIFSADGDVKVAHWWRVNAGEPAGDVAIVSP